MERGNRRGGVECDRDRKDAVKLQLRQPSPVKPDPKGIAPKKIVSSSGLLIQIFERKPIRKPTQNPKKVFHSIENNQEKSKEPGTAHTVQKKNLLCNKQKEKKEKSQGTRILQPPILPEGQKGRGRRMVPDRSNHHQKKRKQTPAATDWQPPPHPTLSKKAKSAKVSKSPRTTKTEKLFLLI